MKALLAGAAVAALIYSPALAAEYYIVQDPSTRRCTIVEQRPANPGIGVVLGPRHSASGPRRKATCGQLKCAAKRLAAAGRVVTRSSSKGSSR